jgi:hypothetical protein
MVDASVGIGAHSLWATNYIAVVGYRQSVPQIINCAKFGVSAIDYRFAGLRVLTVTYCHLVVSTASSRSRYGAFYV